MQWKISVFLSIVCVSQITCTDNGCILFGNVQYTRCLKKSPNVVQFGIDDAHKKEIVDYHNKRRAEASATKMMKIYWNETLAINAQKWANQCPTEHDYLNARSVPGWEIPIGQNLGYGLPNPVELAKMWFEEKDLWEHGERANMIIGHFTQMLAEQTALIGCGFSTCAGGGYHFICNYALGQPSSAIEIPYEKGPRCKNCPATCVDGLCDCHGRICFHYGTINPNTCKCKCHPNFHGDLCEHKSCSATDHTKCAQIPERFKKFYCNRYSNIPVECPFMCGVCP